MVGTAGEPLRFDCKGRKKLTTISKPVAWRFTATSGSETIPILRWNTLLRENETLPLFQPDDSLHFERLHHVNSGIYKCYVNYELVTIIKVEVIGWYIHLIKSFLSSLTLIVVSIMFLILLSALCLPETVVSIHPIICTTNNIRTIEQKLTNSIIKNIHHFLSIQKNERNKTTD